jgi:hypothetical protein
MGKSVSAASCRSVEQNLVEEKSFPSGHGVGLAPSFDSSSSTTSSLFFEDTFVFVDAILANRLGMTGSPPIRKQFEQILRTNLQLSRIVLRGMSQFLENIFQIVMHHQVISRSAACDTHQLHAAFSRLGMPKK